VTMQYQNTCNTDRGTFPPFKHEKLMTRFGTASLKHEGSGLRLKTLGFHTV
jgi:hypothetical protein